jgi:hypothetical protein
MPFQKCSDLISPDYFLWGHLKGQVYKNNPRTLDQLKNSNGMEIAKINGVKLRRVSTNMLKRVELFLQQAGRF